MSVSSYMFQHCVWVTVSETHCVCVCVHSIQVGSSCNGHYAATDTTRYQTNSNVLSLLWLPASLRQNTRIINKYSD